MARRGFAVVEFLCILPISMSVFQLQHCSLDLQDAIMEEIWERRQGQGLLLTNCIICICIISYKLHVNLQLSPSKKFTANNVQAITRKDENNIVCGFWAP